MDRLQIGFAFAFITNREDMSSITSKDYCNAAIATLIPGSVAALGAVLITRKAHCVDYVKVCLFFQLT